MFEKLTKKSHFLNFASEASYVYIFIEKVSKKKFKNWNWDIFWWFLNTVLQFCNDIW